MSEQNHGSDGSLASRTAVLSITMLGVSAGNYLLNIGMARLLPAAEFGDANLAINLVLLSSALAAMLQMVAARSVAGGSHAPAVRHRLRRWAKILGLIVAAGLIVFAPVLRVALQTRTSSMFVLIGIGLPVYLIQAVDRGLLQGQLRIPRLALSYAVEAGVRVLIGFALILAGFGVTGACVAICLSFIGSGLVARPDAERRAAYGESAELALRRTSAGALLLLSGQVLISTGDVLIAKWAFDPVRAGAYAAMALIGRAPFFLSWAVVNAAFPTAAQKSATPADRRRTLFMSIGLLVGLSSACVLAIVATGRWTLPLLLGDSHQFGLGLLTAYCLATTIFSVANLLASMDLAVEDLGSPALLLAGGLLQTGLLFTATSPAEMVTVQVVAMTVTLAVMAMKWIWSSRTRDRSAAEPEPGDSEPGDSDPTEVKDRDGQQRDSGHRHPRQQPNGEWFQAEVAETGQPH